MKYLICLALTAFLSCKKNNVIIHAGEWETNEFKAQLIAPGIEREWTADWSDRMFTRTVSNGGIASLITITGKSEMFSITISLSNIFTSGDYRFGEDPANLRYIRLNLTDWRTTPHLYNYINNYGLQSGKLIIEALDYYHIKGSFQGEVTGALGKIEIINGIFEGVFHY